MKEKVGIIHPQNVSSAQDKTTTISNKDKPEPGHHRGPEQGVADETEDAARESRSLQKRYREGILQI